MSLDPREQTAFKALLDRTAAEDEALLHPCARSFGRRSRPPLRTTVVTGNPLTYEQPVFVPQSRHV